MPVLRHMKLAWPAAEIYWWIDAGLAPLLENDPDLQGIVRFERKRWASPRNWGEMCHSICWLRAQKFDLVVDLQSLARSGAFAWLADGGLLVGLNEIREGARGFFDVAVSRPTQHTHAVDWYLSVLPHLGITVRQEFTWLPEQKRINAALCDRWKTSRGRWIAFQPGARWNSKRWPVEHFSKLAKLIQTELPSHFISILGGKDDQQLGETIASASPTRCLNLAGRLSLPEMVEWIRISDLMVTNDTGPMHVAAALRKPVVAMFGPTDSRRTGPYGQVDRVLRQPPPCAPCFKGECSYFKPLECLRAITPEQVLEEIKHRLGRGDLATQPKRATLAT